ncbi:hypothetical protein M407DRAFT_233077 [Tulasnella calospora MUT 4182]|uniref:Uncharacterized protein n=1 Tax=Tulasnella calospora MUT 4182 TaxID=1051891 RepID=A0A0C3QL82_9AGAM|nr:hypothetical protein M407DRAFT_233077 [Tulasnella calospora MUT 4182]
MFQVFQMTKGESSDELVLGEPSTHDETRSVKRRNRVLLSCIPCHDLRRKLSATLLTPRFSVPGSSATGKGLVHVAQTTAKTGDQDELSRLRKRVLELEHVVRVLTQRHSPREPFDEKVLQPGASSPQGSADDDAKGKKPGSVVPGQSGTPHGTPSSGGGLLGSFGHCGCAVSSVGRQILGQLQTNLAESILKLKALPEHQRLNVNCPLYAQVVHLHYHIGQGAGSPSLQQAVYPGGAPQQSYGLQSPYAPTASSHSSASPPQTDFIAFNQNDPNFDLLPAEPYPYNAPHSSTLSRAFSHPVPHPQLSSGTTSHGQANMPYTLAGIPYQQYQQPAQPVQQYAAAMPRAGPSSSTQPSSLSAWNSVGGNPTSAAQSSHRPSGKSTRSPSTRPAK